MKAYLKGCSEQVDFETKTIKHFLQFQREDGFEFQIPSTETATHQLVAILSGDAPGEKVPAVGEEDLEIRDVSPSIPEMEGATTFGGDVSSFDPTTPPEETSANPTFEVHDPNESPQNEDEVPSL